MNGNYTKLEDINMSFKLWNNSYYNVIFKNIEDIKNKKEECLKKKSQAMEEMHVVTEDFYDSVMDRESKTTTTIGNGFSLKHGSQTALN